MERLLALWTPWAALLCLALPAPASAVDWNFGIWKVVSGSGTLKSESRKLPAFTGIALSLPGEVEIQQGDSDGVSVESDDNLLPQIETVVDNGRLELRSASRRATLKATRLKFIVTVRSLSSLEVSGSGDMRATALKTAKLKVSIHGSGDIRIGALEADALELSIAGSGDFEAAGRATRVHASIAGSGDIMMGKLEAKEVKVSIAGSGDASVWATETLAVSVAGSGDLLYYGDPKLKRSIVGAGSVTRLGARPN